MKICFVYFIAKVCNRKRGGGVFRKKSAVHTLALDAVWFGKYGDLSNAAS